MDEETVEPRWQPGKRKGLWIAGLAVALVVSSMWFAVGRTTVGGQDAQYAGPPVFPSPASSGQPGGQSNQRDLPPQNPECPYTPIGEPVESYIAGGTAPAKTGQGVKLRLTVDGDGACSPLPGLTVDVWHEGPDGAYAPQYRHVGTTDSNGKFGYTTTPTTVSGEDTPHIHFRVSGPGIETLWGTIPMPPKPKTIRMDLTVHQKPGETPKV